MLRFAAAILMALVFPGCAYFTHGSTTRIELQRKGNETVFINKKRISDTIKSVEINNQNDYMLAFKTGSQPVTEEPVSKRFNYSMLGDLVVWPSIFADLSLGSQNRIIDGDRYKVVGAGFSLQDACETESKRQLQSHIWKAYGFFLAAAIMGFEANDSTAKLKKNGIFIPLEIGVLAGGFGFGYHVYKIGSTVGDIGKCIEKRSFNSSF